MERATKTTQRTERTMLIAARQRLCMTQEEVARKLGVDKTSVHRWEKDGAIPQGFHLRALCNLYDASPQALGFSVYDTYAPVPAPIEGSEDALSVFRRQDLTFCLLRLVWNWPRHTEHSDELQHLITLELAKGLTMTDEITRREALRRLAALPVEMFGLQAALIVSSPASEILAQCAAGITACCHLSKKKDLAFVSSIISSYLPSLKEIVRSGSPKLRKAAADVLAQCLLLASTLAKHVTNNQDAISSALQAEKYSETAENDLLHLMCVRMQATAYYYAGQFQKALAAAEKARYLLLEAEQKKSLPSLVHSYVYAGLASRQAYFGEKQNALGSLEKAQNTFYAQSNKEPLPIWIHHSEASLNLNDALTHLHLERYKEASDSFQSATLSTGAQATQIEALINLVRVELSRDDQPRDMEKCIALWKQGMEGTRKLQSEQWFTETSQAYNAMRAAWPGERSIKDLREQIVHW